MTARAPLESVTRLIYQCIQPRVDLSCETQSGDLTDLTAPNLDMNRFITHLNYMNRIPLASHHSSFGSINEVFSEHGQATLTYAVQFAISKKNPY